MDSHNLTWTNDTFYNISDLRASRIAGLTCAALTTVVIPPLLYSVIWFENNISEHRKVSSNKPLAISVILALRARSHWSQSQHFLQWTSSVSGEEKCSSTLQKTVFNVNEHLISLLARINQHWEELRKLKWP